MRGLGTEENGERFAAPAIISAYHCETRVPDHPAID